MLGVYHYWNIPIIHFKMSRYFEWKTCFYLLLGIPFDQRVNIDKYKTDWKYYIKQCSILKTVHISLISNFQWNLCTCSLFNIQVTCHILSLTLFRKFYTNLSAEQLCIIQTISCFTKSKCYQIVWMNDIFSKVLSTEWLKT